MLAALPDDRRASARNLLHYLAVRQHDIRELQDRLAERGLSSLGRMEPHALASIESVLAALCRLDGRADVRRGAAAPADFAAGARLLAARTESLLGPAPKARRVRVMVTMPSEAARSLSSCATSSRRAWTSCESTAPTMTPKRLAAHGREHAGGRSRGRPSVPRGRATSPDRSSAPVRSSRAPWSVTGGRSRDDAGRSLARRALRIVAEHRAGPASPDGVLPIERELLQQLRAGASCASRTCAVKEPGTHRRERLSPRRRSARPIDKYLRRSRAEIVLHRDGAAVAIGRVGDPARVEQRAAPRRRRQPRRDPKRAGRPAERDEAGRVVRPASIGCTLPGGVPRRPPGRAASSSTTGRSAACVHEVGERRPMWSRSRARAAGRRSSRRPRASTCPTPSSACRR